MFLQGLLHSSNDDELQDVKQFIEKNIVWLHQDTRELEILEILESSTYLSKENICKYQLISYSRQGQDTGTLQLNMIVTWSF